MTVSRVRKVLVVAYNFPPMLGTSAAQRTLSLCRYLPGCDWQPLILAPTANSYPHSDPDQLRKIPEETIVHRSLALDSARVLSIRGKQLPYTDIPDRWSNWWLSAVPAGLRMIRKFQPDAILSTFPIATAHMIALTLHKISGLPWLADFRDVMIEDDYPSDPKRRRSWVWLEGQVMEHASHTVFTTQGAANLYGRRYSDELKRTVIGNAFDEQDFAESERQASQPKPSESAPVRVIHSGILYRHERDPAAFLAALHALKQRGLLGAATLQVILRGARNDRYCSELIEQYKLQDMVRIEPVVPYHEAIREMFEADGLLVLQGSVCNNQIPAKVYEYLRTRKPILALTDPGGDTAGVLTAARAGRIAPLDSQTEIESAVLEFLTEIKTGSAKIASDTVISSHTRQARAMQFADLLTSVQDSSQALN